MDAALVSALAERYLLDRELGAGGMATVYLAPDLKHDRLVAIKALKPELAAVIGGERFLSEIKTTANLQHPHILALFDSGEVGGLLFYATPFMGRERLTGDPPHKGSTVQAVIATVITEHPGSIRAVRLAVPEHILAAGGGGALTEEALPVLVGDSVPDR